MVPAGAEPAGGMTEIDARGLLCPLPVLRLRKILAAALEGELVALIATDEMARVDVPHFCAEAGHRLVSLTEEDGHTRYLLRKDGWAAGWTENRIPGTQNGAVLLGPRRLIEYFYQDENRTTVLFQRIVAPVHQ